MTEPNTDNTTSLEALWADAEKPTPILAAVRMLVTQNGHASVLDVINASGESEARVLRVLDANRLPALSVPNRVLVAEDRQPVLDLDADMNVVGLNIESQARHALFLAGGTFRTAGTGERAELLCPGCESVMGPLRSLVTVNERTARIVRDVAYNRAALVACGIPFEDDDTAWLTELVPAIWHELHVE